MSRDMRTNQQSAVTFPSQPGIALTTIYGKAATISLLRPISGIPELRKVNESLSVRSEFAAICVREVIPLNLTRGLIIPARRQ